MAEIEDITERWLPVVGHEGIYSVSNMGRVRRDARGRGTHAGRVLTPGLTTTGYPCVTLWWDGKPHADRIHSLVAKSFIGPRPEGAHVDHIDGRKLNNRVGNLRYVTPAENSAAAYSMGLSPVGDRHKNTRLSDRAAAVLFSRRLSGESGRKLAAEFGISEQTVCDIMAGRRRHRVTGMESTRPRHTTPH